MENQIHDNELPWSLIEAALQGNLTSEDKLQLESWLMESPANRANFERLKQVWKEGMADYPIYLEADESRAWSEMQARLDSGSATPIVGDGGRSTAAPVVRSISWKRWAVAAAVLLVVMSGAEFWRISRKGGAE